MGLTWKMLSGNGPNVDDAKWEWAQASDPSVTGRKWDYHARAHRPSAVSRRVIVPIRSTSNPICPLNKAHKARRLRGGSGTEIPIGSVGSPRASRRRLIRLRSILEPCSGCTLWRLPVPMPCHAGCAAEEFDSHSDLRVIMNEAPYTVQVAFYGRPPATSRLPLYPPPNCHRRAQAQSRTNHAAYARTCDAQSQIVASIAFT
jgi:hypothetical protein